MKICRVMNYAVTCCTALPANQLRACDCSGSEVSAYPFMHFTLTWRWYSGVWSARSALCISRRLPISTRIPLYADTPEMMVRLQAVISSLLVACRCRSQGMRQWRRGADPYSQNRVRCMHWILSTYSWLEIRRYSGQSCSGSCRNTPPNCPTRASFPCQAGQGWIMDNLV